MRLREKTAWVIAAGSLVALTVHAIEAHRTKREAAQWLYDCGSAIEACNERCAHAADVVYDFGDRVVDCIEDLCRRNHWVPPPDWEEGLEAAKEGRLEAAKEAKEGRAP